MSARQYKSGTENRKLVLDQEKERNKCAKIETFFKPEHKSINSYKLPSEQKETLFGENLPEGSEKLQYQEEKTRNENV